jgi:intermembrane space import and assembly protein 40
MFRPTSNCLIRGTSLRSLSRTSTATCAASRRFLSTAKPVQKSGSWKGTAVRWGLAGAAVYYYNTSNVFAEEPACKEIPLQIDGLRGMTNGRTVDIHAPPETNQETETSLTLDTIAKRKEQRDASSSPLDAKVVDQTSTSGPLGEGGAAPGSPEELEEEAGQEGAFNPETGEINWDCPCLGGMANGPCGEEFKAAFSCFVYSTEEPKGVDCIDRFK